MAREITNRMENVEIQLQDLFTNVYCKKDFEKKLEAAQVATTDSRLFILSDLARMINEVGYECEYGKPISYYEKIVQGLKLPENIADINKKIIDTLNRVYSDYPTPEEFMRRIVDSLEPETALAASLRLRILRRFLKTVNVKENKKYYSKSLAQVNADEIGESIFDVLSDPKAKKECDYFNIVQASSNLSNGMFISPVMTKAWLFMFAFAFDMRYYAYTDKEYDANKDVEKNLFFDYYCDNITRYLYSEDGGDSGSSDKEPSGLGINSKNFVDAVFVYYLNKEGMSSTQKVTGFYSMLNRVKKSWKTMYPYDDEKRKSYEARSTSGYDYKISTSIHQLSEEEFEEYVLKEYYCDVREVYGNDETGEVQEVSKGNFDFQISTNSEYKEYIGILELIKEHLGLPSETDFSSLDGRTVADRKTIDAIYGMVENIPNTEDKYFTDLENEENDYSNFLRIIKNIEQRLNPFEAVSVNDPLKMTRTKLIAAFYHFYCLELEANGGMETWRSFKDVYEDFSICANQYLTAARYQPISPKNLYDVFVIFFAYCNIHSFLE